MAAKKKHNSGGPKQHVATSGGHAPAAKKNNTKLLLAIGTFAVVAVVIGLVMANGGSNALKKGAPEAPAEEQKYIGRLLPSGYIEPKLAEAAAYSSTLKMFKATPTQDDTGVSIPVADIVSNKIVSFDYQKVGAEALSLIAYVKPSGKLFVGVSYCPPCKGKGQRIESDGTLTCETCGTKRDLESQVGISGACKLYPLDELPAEVSADTIVVGKSALDGWTAQPLDRKVGS